MYQRKRNPRAPRKTEIAFLQMLAGGPQPVTRGPLGQCLKHGWCIKHEADADVSGDGSILYAITPEGLKALAQASS